jgi:hypothetical protein
VIALWCGSRRKWKEIKKNEPVAHIEPVESFVDESLVLLKYIMKKETTLDYGAPMDLVLINSVNENEDCSEYLEYLNSFHGKLTKNGKIQVIHRKNIGISFGSFDHAWQIFQDQYDYWFFTEDEYIMTKDNVLSTAIKCFEESPNLGFVSTVRMIKVGCHGPQRWMARGSSGITTNSVLKKCAELNNGTLPYWNQKSDHRMDQHERFERKLGLLITDNLERGGLGMKMRIFPQRYCIVKWREECGNAYKKLGRKGPEIPCATWKENME